MGYANLAQCVLDLEKNGFLRRIDVPLDPVQEIAAIQRRALRARGPALLFTRPKGCAFPLLGNLFGTMERLKFIFRDSLSAVEQVLKGKAEPQALLRKPWEAVKLLPALGNMRPRYVKKRPPVLESSSSLADLPHFVSWPGDGGPFITLPLVYSEFPGKPGAANLGMYRVQLSGNDYEKNEAGLHYQTQRGIGVHHAHALEQGQKLPVHIYVGGPPALTVCAVMPLPEGLSEILFAGLLGARRMELYSNPDFQLPVLAQCDFFIKGVIGKGLKPEGPFGDHLGYYSLKHDFPFVEVEHVWHRSNAIWPFTSVGRPPQEDTVFGDFIHQLTAPLVGQVFEGIRDIHAVDAAGVHPLLLAVGSERYTAYEAARRPRELLTCALHLLGTTQTALAKYLFICAHEDAPGLSARDVPNFLRHMLERVDLRTDLHFLTGFGCDTLDYSGTGLHEGSKLIWASAGEKIRNLGTEISGLPQLPRGFGNACLVAPGVVAVAGPAHDSPRGQPDPILTKTFCRCLETWTQRENFPLLVIVDDPEFCASSLENFLWVAFTRSDPATDTYGINAQTIAKHWSCGAPLVIDARAKAFHAPPLTEDPAVAAHVENMAARGGPLEGLF